MVFFNLFKIVVFQIDEMKLILVHIKEGPKINAKKGKKCLFGRIGSFVKCCFAQSLGRYEMLLFFLSISVISTISSLELSALPFSELSSELSSSVSLMKSAKLMLFFALAFLGIGSCLSDVLAAGKSFLLAFLEPAPNFKNPKRESFLLEMDVPRELNVVLVAVLFELLAEFPVAFLLVVLALVIANPKDFKKVSIGLTVHHSRHEID